MLKRLIGRRKQIVVIARMLDEKVEGLGTHRRRSEHEGHLPIDFADDHDLPALPALRRQNRQQIHRYVGIRPKTVFGAAIDAAFCDKLADNVDALGGHIARHMRIVGADIVTLRMRDVRRRRVQKKFDNLHIAWDISRGADR